MRNLLILFLTAFALAIALIVPVDAKNDVTTATLGGMRIELCVLQAEPFFTADEVTKKNVKEGMLIVGGAAPLLLEGNIYSNRHLVVHIFDEKTGQAITKAEVKMSFQPLDTHGKPSGDSVRVPIVIMQAIGKGLESTHYGNNAVMPEGAYAITVVADGQQAAFQVTLSKDAAASAHHMHMHMP